MNRASKVGRSGAAALAAGALAFGLAALGTADASTGPASVHGHAAASTDYKSYVKSLYNAATKTGQTSVVLYSAYGSTNPTDPLNKLVSDFEQEYPAIKVTVQDSSGASLFAEVDGEFASGKKQIDAVLSGPSDVGHFIDQKRLVAWKPRDAVQVEPDLVESHGYYTVPFRHLFGLVYNTRDLKASQVPTTVAQLANPKWKGKVAIGEPNGASPSDFAITTLLYDKLITPAQLKAIAANATLRGQNTANADVISGRAEIGIWGPSEQAVIAAQSGAPVAFQKFAASDFDAPGYGIFTNAPHPLAAKVLEAWLISNQGQQALQKDTPFYGVWKKPLAPLHGPGAAGDEVVPQIPADKFESQIKKYRSLVVSIFGKGQGA